MIQWEQIYSLKLQNIVERKVGKIQIVRNERKPNIYAPRLERVNSAEMKIIIKALCRLEQLLLKPKLVSLQRHNTF